MIRNCNDFPSENILQRGNGNKNHLKNVIASDNIWFYSYDVETTQQFSHRRSSASSCHKIKPQVRLQLKGMLVPPPTVIEALCVMNSLLKVRQSRFLPWFSDICGMRYKEIDPKCIVR
jgi:hypothetical protein